MKIQLGVVVVVLALSASVFGLGQRPALNVEEGAPHPSISWPITLVSSHQHCDDQNAVFGAGYLAGQGFASSYSDDAAGVLVSAVNDGVFHILLHMGQRNTGGYGIELTGDRLSTEAGYPIQLPVRYTEPTGMATMALTAPCALFRVDGSPEHSIVELDVSLYGVSEPARVRVQLQQ